MAQDFDQAKLEELTGKVIGDVAGVPRLYPPRRRDTDQHGAGGDRLES